MKIPVLNIHVYTYIFTCFMCILYLNSYLCDCTYMCNVCMSISWTFSFYLKYLIILSIKNPCFQSQVLQKKPNIFFSLPVYFSEVKKILKILRWFLNIWICIFQIATHVLYVICVCTCTYMYACIFFNLILLGYIYYPVLGEEWYSLPSFSPSRVLAWDGELGVGDRGFG